ncbi:MAG: hypothetical protein FD126_674, partial [Elusimicrobia bacterium]
MVIAESGSRRAERRGYSRAALLSAASFLLSVGAARADWALQNPSLLNPDYTSIVVDTNTYPHILFRDLGVDEMYIADWNGTSWAVSQPDTTNNRGIGGRLAIDRGGNLHAAYQMTSPKGQFYAKRTGATWGTVVQLNSGGNLSVNAQSCIAVSSSSAGDFVHAGWTTAGDLMYAKSVNGGASFAAQATVDAPASVTVGDYCAMASTGASVHVSYFDTTNGDLKYAYINGASITISTVDQTATAVGLYTSIALDASTRPHITYYDSTNGDLKHAYKNGAVWVIETVDSTGDVGQHTSLVMSSMNARIAYYDVTNTNLKYAEYNGTSWALENADSAGDMGKFASLALDSQGQLHSAHVYWISSSSGNVRYGLRAPTPNCDNIASAGTGNWSLAATWSGGLVPTSCNRVTVASGHTVTVDVTTGAASATTLSGILKFRRTGHSKLVVTGGDVTVAPGGLLDLGTESSPIPVGSTATLTLASGTSAGLWGLIVQEGGVFTVRGATKTPFGYALATLSGGAVSLTISASSSTNWSVGDTIVIGPTTGTGASTAEERVITALSGTDPKTVTWASGLSNAHTRTDDTPVFVANVSRNAVVTSSGASSGEASYVRSLVTSATSFYAAHAEFAGLGANASGKYGVTLDGAFAQGSVSSAAFRGGYQGLRLSGGFSAVMPGLLLYKNTDAGLSLVDGGAHAFSESLAVSNGGAGFSLSSSSGTSFTGVRAAANGGAGFLLSATASDIAISSSASHDNVSHGVSVAHANAKRLNLSNSSVYANGGDGVNVADASDAALSESYEVRACGAGGVKVQVNSAKVNAANGGIVSTSFCAGDQASSYNENGVSGSVRIFGDYQVPVASTFTMNFSKRSNAPAYTGPTAVKGKDHTLTAIVVTTSAVNELFKTVNEGGTTWSVTGQKSGLIGTITCGASATCPFSGPIPGAKVAFNLVTASSIKTGDRIHLVTHRPSADTGAAKTVSAGRACPTLNGGNTKITIPAGAGIELVGIGTSPVTITTLDSGSTYFTFVASGAFTMDHASVTRGDPEGLHLSGTGPIHLSSASFDDTGATDTPGCSHLTFQSLGITASFPGVYVGNRSACSAMKGVKVLPGSCSGSVSLTGMEGPLGGPDNVDDAACSIAVSGGPFIPGSLSSTFTAVNVTSVTARWGSNANPADAQYTLQASTAANFTGTLASSVTYSTQAVTPGLTPNSTYYFRVFATTVTSSDYRSLGSTVTAPATPSATALVVVATGTATLGWTTDGNPAGGTLYLAQLSTGSDFSGTLSSSQTADSQALFAGLTANTTYYLRVRARGRNGDLSPFDATVTTATAAMPPTGSAVAAVTATTLQLSWGANTNPGGTLYAAQVSTMSSFAPVLSSSETLGTSSTFTGLTPNTTYYARVRTRMHAGVESAYDTAQTSATTANAPTVPVIVSMTFDTVVFGWNANSNPGGTRYLAHLSTASNFTGTVTSSETFATNATFPSLASNTTYYLRVRARGFGGSDSGFSATASTKTAGGAVAPTSPAVTLTAATALSYSWGDGGNLAGTQYRALLSTSSGFTGGGDASSDTLNTTSAFTSLTPNTTYYFKVKALGSGGPDSAFTASLTSSTVANPPVTAAVSAVTPTTSQLSWGANSNPAGTVYAAQLSTASDFSGTLSSSQTFGISALFSGLAANTTYYLRVKARGHGGSESAYSVASASATDVNAPVTAAVSAVSPTTAQLGWGANSNPSGTRYAAQLSTASNFSGTLTSSQTLGTSALFSGLTANTTYYLRVKTLGHGGAETAYAVAAASSTDANAPVTAAVSAVTPTTANLGWGANSNPSGTRYTAQLSTASNFTGTLSSSQTFGVTAAFTGLSANTTYYLRVKALGHGGAESDYAVAAASATDSNAPVTAAVSAVTPTTANLGWGANSNPAGTLFGAQLSTATNFSGTLTSSQTYGTSAGFTGLSPNTTYYLRVKALGHGGAESAYSVASASATDSNAPVTAAVSAVTPTTAQLGWGTNSNPAGTLFTAQIAEQAAFTSVLASSATFNAAATFSGLTPNATYYLRVRAHGHGGSSSAYGVASASATEANPPTNAEVQTVGNTGLRLLWEANVNPGGTRYEAHIATGSDFTGTVTSSRTFGMFATYNGLTANTSYYLRVRALGFGGTASAFGATVSSFTTVGAAMPSPPSVTLAQTTTLDYAWSDGINNAGTQYRALLSTAPGFSGASDKSSDTLNTTAGFTGLIDNTTYYFRVKALGGGGPDSAYTATLTSSTLSNAPTGTTVTATTTGTYVASWGQGSNPAGTRFIAELSGASDFSGTPALNQVVGTQATFAGLSANTTYYVRVRAFGHGGALSGYNATVSSATNAGAPVTAAVSAVSPTTAQLGWGADVNSAGTRFVAQVSTASNFTGTLTSSQTFGVTAGFTGLTPNTTYYLRVSALGHGGALTAYAVAAASATETNAPTSPSVLAATANSAQLGWNANSNPAGTLYSAQRSTASDFTGTLTSSATYDVQALFSGLAANTTYYLRSRAVGHGASLSAFTSTVSTFTTASALLPVSAAVVSAATTTLSTSWGDGGNPAGTQYRALVSTTSAFTGGADGSSTTLNVTADFAGLTANTTYYFKVKALGGAGPDSAYTATLTSSTLAAPPVTAAV